MKIIVDTNIVFSALLNINSRIAQMLIYAQPPFKLYSCHYLKTEIFKHQHKLLKLTKLTPDELFELLGLVTCNITFINEALLPKKLLDSMQKILQDIDPFDLPFVALATHMDAILWTGDLKLTNGLRAKNLNNVISTAGLAALYDEVENKNND